MNTNRVQGEFGKNLRRHSDDEGFSHELRESRLLRSNRFASSLMLAMLADQSAIPFTTPPQIQQEMIQFGDGEVLVGGQ